MATKLMSRVKKWYISVFFVINGQEGQNCLKNKQGDWFRELDKIGRPKL